MPNCALDPVLYPFEYLFALTVRHWHTTPSRTRPEEMSQYVWEHAEELHFCTCITCTSVVHRRGFGLVACRLTSFSAWVFHACLHKHHWWWRALVALCCAKPWSGNRYRYGCQHVTCRAVIQQFIGLLFNVFLFSLCKMATCIDIFKWHTQKFVDRCVLFYLWIRNATETLLVHDEKRSYDGDENDMYL